MMMIRTRIIALTGAGLLAAGLLAGSVGWVAAQGPWEHGGYQMRQMPGPHWGGQGWMDEGHGMAGMRVDSEFDYLTQMIPHHEEAIASAQQLLNGTNRPEMQEFARSIIETQSAEVARMRTYLDTWYPGQPTDVSYTPMMRDLTGLTGDALDEAFLRDMIPHHMMAVMMSQQLLMRGLSQHSEVNTHAYGIRDAQRGENHDMAGWLTRWSGGGSMVPPAPGGMRGPGGHGMMGQMRHTAE
jgi:uncharacterized protein (DUF305 family)